MTSAAPRSLACAVGVCHSVNSQRVFRSHMINIKIVALVAAAVLLAVVPSTLAFQQACATSSNQVDVPGEFEIFFEDRPTTQEAADAAAEYIQDLLEAALGGLDCGPCAGIGCDGIIQNDMTEIGDLQMVLKSVEDNPPYEFVPEYTVHNGDGGKVWLECTPCILPL